MKIIDRTFSFLALGAVALLTVGGEKMKENDEVASDAICNINKAVKDAGQTCKGILGPDTTKTCIQSYIDVADKTCEAILGRLAVNPENRQACREIYTYRIGRVLSRTRW